MIKRNRERERKREEKKEVKKSLYKKEATRSKEEEYVKGWREKKGKEREEVNEVM